MSYGMDYENSGGGGGGFGGGTPGGSPPGSAGGGGRTRKSYDEQSIHPVTVSMCLNASGSDDSLTLADGRGLHHVKLVGAVRSSEDFSTNCVYKLEDGTGLIEVKQWVDPNDCGAVAELRQACQKENIYVTVVGTIKDYNGSKTIVADSVRPVYTGNEITCHMLDCVYSAEKASRANSYVTAPAVSHQQQGIGFGGGTPLQQQSYGSGGGGGDGGIKEQVRMMIQSASESSESGANVAECVRQVGCSEHEVRKIIEDLSSEGLVYSTIDDNHYKFAM